MMTVGFLELNSIARGIYAADAVMKAADVRLVLARPGCPGKYHILVSGEVAAVQAAIEAGIAAGAGSVVDSLVIPRVHPGVIDAIGCACPPICPGAVGVLEYFGVTASVNGADAAVKAADVELLDLRLGMGIGGKSFVVLTGDVAAVEEAVRCGVKTAETDGMLVAGIVIPSPDPDLLESLY